MWNTLLVSDQQMRWNTEVSTAQLCSAVGLIVTSSQDSVSSCLCMSSHPRGEERVAAQWATCQTTYPSLGLRTPSLLAAPQRFSEDSIHKNPDSPKKPWTTKAHISGALRFFFVVCLFLFVSCFFSPWSGAVRLELNWENMTVVCGMFAETLGRVPSGHMA